MTTAANTEFEAECIRRIQAGEKHVFHDLVRPCERAVYFWEGTRLLNAVKGALPKLKGPVTILARVSEGPEQRQKLTAQIRAMLAQNGVKTSKVEVLCAFKQGFSWLMD